jgi:hypothetical protein
MSKLEHTPGPWAADSNRRTIYTKAANIKGNVICVEPDDDMKESQKYWNANKERIVACVNACDGIPHPEHLPLAVKFLKWSYANGFKATPDKKEKITAGVEKLLKDLGVIEAGHE